MHITITADSSADVDQIVSFLRPSWDQRLRQYVANLRAGRQELEHALVWAGFHPLIREQFTMADNQTDPADNPTLTAIEAAEAEGALDVDVMRRAADFINNFPAMLQAAIDQASKDGVTPDQLAPFVAVVAEAAKRRANLESALSLGSKTLAG